ncbi:hypothetical protein MKX01_022045 [Papaver californicum]|nr:hypothetical protein MKX01_022045 [Papaver californicum]
MVKHDKKERKILAFIGGIAIAAFALNLIISAIHKNNQKNKKNSKKDIPGSNIRVNLTGNEILKLADQVIAKSKEVTYANVILPIAELEAHQFPLVQSCVFQRMVAVPEEVRKASAEAEKKIDDHILMCSKREEVQRLRAQIDELSMQYIQNLNDDCTSLLFSETDLLGLPPTFIQSLEMANNGKLKINLRGQHVSPLLEYCKVGSTRKMVAIAYGRRCGETNLSLLENLVQLRHKLARLLGYPNYVDYAVEPRMAKMFTKVFEFLENISISLTDLATRELAALKDLKKQEEGQSPFGMEDLLYYVKRAEEQNFDLDYGVVNQYFPISLVFSGIFKIFQDLFGLKFEEMADAEVWHNDVRCFSALDLSSSEHLGYFYLDIYSREAMYDQTCVVALQNGLLSSNGARQMPVALLLSHFQKEVDGSSRLLRFSEVVNLFHEVGHVVHHICNRVSFARFSGFHVDPDFVEIPSQVLENWCYESSTLKLMSGFHQDITKPVTDEMCPSSKKRRDSFSAIKLKQEILLCLLDQIIHSSENVDTMELLKHLHPKIKTIPIWLPILEGTNPASCFPRLAIGYEASCYSRIWSEMWVFAAGIFATKYQNGRVNPHVGMQFRNKVLAPGGSKEPIEMLSDFLGSEPSIQAYIENKTKNSL